MMTTPMKTIAFVFGLIMCCIPARFTAQSTSQNFIKKTVPTSPVTTETNLNFLSSTFKVESIHYTDGMGRPLQDVLVKASPNNNDIIQPYLYDQYGRQASKYLPYTDASASGTYRGGAFYDQLNFYTNQTMVAKTAYPFSETVFDGSPLNEAVEQSAPDSDWILGSGHTNKQDIGTNSTNEVIQWLITSAGDYIPDPAAKFYPSNSLTRIKVTDANGNEAYIFTDQSGKTICTKQYFENRSTGSLPNGDIYGRQPNITVPYYLTTYMVYDDFGRLVLVIPPKALDLMDASQNYSVNGLMEDLVFRYVYDKRHRLIEKKAPGIGWQYIVYNSFDKPVLFRDANLEAQNKWNFIKYDVLGRPILSGLMNASGMFSYQSRALAQTAIDAGQVQGESEIQETVNTPFGYTNLSLPNQNLDILTVNYYDDYDFNNDGTADCGFNYNAVPCLAFNIANLGSIHNKMQNSVTAGTSMTDAMNSAISISSGNARMLSRLNYCLSQLNSLKPIMESNAAKSYSLTLADNEGMLSELNLSLQGQTTTLNKAIADTIAACKRNDPKTNTNFTARLNDIQTGTVFIANKITTSLPLIANIQAGCQPYVNVPNNRTRGYLTGSRVKVLDASNPVQWEISTTFYDEDGQPIQSQSNDHMGGTDLLNLVYDFAGNVIHSQQVHASPGQPTIQVLNHMSFDKMGRLLRVDQKNNADQPVILSTNTYNELSQLIDKKVHSLTNGASFLQSMDYRYNVRGWLTSVNNINLSSDMATNPTAGTNDDVDDLWGMELGYNTPSLGGTGQYSGNVSEKKWRSVDYSKRSYKYEYDKADRLKSSLYAEFSSFTGWNVNVGKYDEKDLSYDANGNIMTLKRYGFQPTGSSFGLIDDLGYQYNGNILSAVTDGASAQGQMDFKDNGATGSGDYSYDSNGNVIANANKDITNISYNHLNLPVLISFGTGNTIKYTYDAAGTRLRKTVTQGSTVTTKNYAGLFEYNNNGLLESMRTMEGRCVTTGALPAFRYEYQYLDNTGNVMLAFSDLDFNNSINASTEVLQQNHYYSFGMRMEGTSNPIVGVENKYKFSGKELDDELGLNEYDFGARMYDPAIARWGCIDPMADMAPHWTPFRYGFNNPITVTDPTGMLEEDWVKNLTTGITEWDNDVDNKEQYDKKYGNDKNYAYVGDWAARAVDKDGSIFNGHSNGEKKPVAGQYAVKNFDGSYSAPTDKNSIAAATPQQLEDGKKTLEKTREWNNMVNWYNHSSGRADQSISPFDFWNPANYLRGATYGGSIVLSRRIIGIGDWEIDVAKSRIKGFTHVSHGFTDVVMHGSDFRKISFMEFDKWLTNQGVTGNIRLWICGGSGGNRAQALANWRRVTVEASEFKIKILPKSFKMLGSKFDEFKTYKPK